ncbi:carbohydrate ABC transporter permease [Paenibacillus eucommiae]|uniref:Multiple sugar transport system permease protein n=1 Tax=Paenibacillus eucommiae TaxID=1355755 RepID=A0ABS4IXU8_9BACL|nr:carbohydrate ABC transporter permease [Paenibacillus eucommiae]MBP1992405.1 multiple sugar transport system permease protein [Paenibacillus eucommiae]
MIKFIRIIIAYAIAACMLLPFLWMVSTSFKNPADVFQFPIKWIPNPINLDGYKYVWKSSVLGVSFYTFYWNSLKVAFFVLAGTFFSCTLAAYAYARINFTGRSVIFMVMIATMMIPFQVTMIPIFMMYKELGLLNTHMALWLPSFFGSMFGVFLLRQFIISLPLELSEAAVIDGAGHFRIYWNIVLPLIKPAITALLILTLVATWNNYEAPLLFIRSAELFTIPVGLKAMADDIYNINYSGIMAGVVSSIVPILLLFALGQRYFVQGLTFSVVKG